MISAFTADGLMVEYTVGLVDLSSVRKICFLEAFEMSSIFGFLLFFINLHHNVSDCFNIAKNSLQ
jgi:hypothetical protein